jgi:hypothetical protein
MEPAGAVPQPQGGSKPTWLYVAGFCCGCALLFVLFFAVVGGGAFMAAAKATAPAKQDARAFLADMQKGDVDAAYAHFTRGLQEKLAKGALETQVKDHPDLYRLASEPSYTSFSNNNGRVHLEGSYDTTGSGRVNVKFTYVEENGAWKMDAIDITPAK